jgi:hypothetical protein
VSCIFVLFLAPLKSLSLSSAKLFKVLAHVLNHWSKNTGSVPKNDIHCKWAVERHTRGLCSLAA